jgi:septal ring factor EnvC (AmiA/AmiB activator)
MMEATGSFKMSVLTRATWCRVTEKDILHSHCCENLKSYIVHACFQAHPSAEQDSLVDKASIILAGSTRLSSRGKQKASHVEELKLKLEEHKEEVKNVRDTLTEAAKADNVISRQLQKLDNREGETSHVSCDRILIKCMLLSVSHIVYNC